MTQESKLSRFILELIKKTKKGQISWSESYFAPDLEDGGVRLVDLSYSATIETKDFRLYKYKVRHYRDEYDWDWEERIKLEIINIDGKSTYEFPYEYSLHDLYDSVRENTSGVHEFIENFLS